MWKLRGILAAIGLSYSAITGLYANDIEKTQPYNYEATIHEKAVDLCANIDEGYDAQTWLNYELTHRATKYPSDNDASYVIAQALIRSMNVECPEYRTHINRTLDRASNSPE